MSKFLTMSVAAAAAFLITAGLSAQTKYVSPSQVGKGSGNDKYNMWPFRVSSTATYRYGRYQEIMDLPAAAKGKLSSFAWRAGLRHMDIGAPPAFSATMEVTVSTAANTAGTMVKAFASNHGSNATLVLAKRIVKFPKFPLLPKFPQPFFFKVPFDTNKVLAFPGSKSLCLDVTVSDNDLYDATKRIYRYFYPDSVAFLSGQSEQTHFGRPGFSSNQGTFMPFYGYTYANIRTFGTVGKGNLQIYAYGYNAVSNNLAFHVLSAGRMPVGIPIADGNSLYVNLGQVVAITPSVVTQYRSVQFPTRVSGKAMTYIMDLPFQNAWRGVFLYGQSFLLDAKANKAGIVSTQLNIVELPKFYTPTGYPLSHVYEYNTSRGKWSNLRLGYGHVTQLNF